MVVVTIGDVMVDWLSCERGASFDSARQFVRSPGGNSLNVAIALRRLGLDTRLIGKLGNDVHGHYLTKQLSKESVDINFLVSDVTYPTANCFAFTNAFGMHSYVEWPLPHAAQMLAADEISEAAFADCNFLVFTGLSMRDNPRRQALLKALNIANKQQIATCFDAALPISESEEDIGNCELPLFKAELLKFNEEELRFWAGHNQNGDGRETIESMSQALFAKYKPKLLVSTLSDQGCYFVTDKGARACPGFSVAAVDEVGAGDAFIAGLVASVIKTVGQQIKPNALDLLSLDDWYQILRFANACGAHVTKAMGAIEMLANYDQVQSLIKFSAMQNANPAVE